MINFAAGSGDGSLTHFFVEPLNDSIAYTSESSQLTNPNPIYKNAQGDCPRVSYSHEEENR